jgi:hypothetical protein
MRPPDVGENAFVPKPGKAQMESADAREKVDKFQSHRGKKSLSENQVPLYMESKVHFTRSDYGYGLSQSSISNHVSNSQPRKPINGDDSPGAANLRGY